MKLLKNTILSSVLLLLQVSAFSLWAQTAETPLPQDSHFLLIPSVTYSPGNEGPLTSKEIVITALEYSLCSVDSPEGKMCLSKYSTMERACQKKLGQLSQLEAAEAILGFMYDGILLKYVEHSTKLNTTLITGEYNCVTASIMYMALATSLGIEVHGQETTLHAFCKVTIDGTTYDVETTNPYGFNPGTKKQVEASANTRKFSYVPKKYYAGQRQISDRAFATLTGKNLASDFNDYGKYETAIPLEVSRLEMLKNAGDSEEITAKNDLDVLSSNYATVLAKQKQTEQALDYLDEVILRWGNSKILTDTYGNLVYNGTVDFLNNGQDQEARSFFESRKAGADERMQNRIDKMIKTQVLHRHEVETHNKIVPLFNSGRLEEAKIILEEALQENPDSATLKKDLSLIKRALGQ